MYSYYECLDGRHRCACGRCPRRRHRSALRVCLSLSEGALTNGATAGLYEQTGHDDLVRRYVLVAGAGRLCLKLSRRRRLGVLRRLVL